MSLELLDELVKDIIVTLAAKSDEFESTEDFARVMRFLHSYKPSSPLLALTNLPPVPDKETFVKHGETEIAFVPEPKQQCHHGTHTSAQSGGLKKV